MKKEPLTPGSLLEISGGYWKTCALHAAVKLDLFTLLGEGQMTGEAAARNRGADSRALSMLLNALVAMGLLLKKDDHFGNTDFAREFLSKHSSHYIGYIILHHHQLMHSWARLDEGVMTGRPVRERASGADDTWRKHFLMGMFNMAMQQAPNIVRRVDLSGRKHLLDLGGGPGTYAIHFCRQYPRLKATVYDLPTTRPFAERTIQQFGLAERITFKEGDFRRDEIEGTFDAAWLSHILHGEDFEECKRIVRKAVSALEPGGIIVIHDFILNNSMDGPLFPALFSLNMLLGTEGGQAYSEGQISEMRSRAGAGAVRRIPIESPNDSGIMVGTAQKKG